MSRMQHFFLYCYLRVIKTRIDIQNRNPTLSIRGLYCIHFNQRFPENRMAIPGLAKSIDKIQRFSLKCPRFAVCRGFVASFTPNAPFLTTLLKKVRR